MLKFPRRNELGICFKRKKGKDFKSSVLKKELVYVFFFSLYGQIKLLPEKEFHWILLKEQSNFYFKIPMFSTY